MSAESENNGDFDLSIIIPVYNEEDNLCNLNNEIINVLESCGKKYEIIYIDDGSSDGSIDILEKLCNSNECIRSIFFTRNFGQTAAISAGISEARGKIIIPMDADLQNDPNDIPLFLQKIDEGYDVVSGWRKYRKDPFFSKKLPSRIANWIISVVGGVRLHDYGCSMKAYKKDVIKNVQLYGEMHRFIPLYAHHVGAKITEVAVHHRPRVAGKSKYGLSRTSKVVLDLFTTKFLGTYAAKPIYFFGKIGIYLDLTGIFFGAYSLYDRYFHGYYVHKNPKILLAIFLFILGFQFIMLGILAEMITRTYYESQTKKPYFVKKRLNFD